MFHEDTPEDFIEDVASIINGILHQCNASAEVDIDLDENEECINVVFLNDPVSDDVRNALLLTGFYNYGSLWAIPLDPDPYPTIH